ncbi:MAG TPA: trypsin-like peptidase domain-containing protein [Vicinamibacterales bacterium]|nr:trypsin-like peptidase domain-containing protein [Vicinamibacterales bacterium]
MKWTLALAACLVIGQGTAAAERAASPADATVFIRLVGSVHAELEEPGSAKQTLDLDKIEIGTGSGFVITPYGHVLTNEHVIRNTQFDVASGPRKARITLKVSSILVCLPAATAAARGDASPCYNASVHSSDAALDLAVLFVAADLPYLALGDSDAVRSGQPVDALGYPFGRQLEVGRVAAPDLVPEVSTSPSTISALRSGDAGDRRAVQINGTVNPGNSGGPLVDRDGFAVGVIRARVKGDAGIAFAIPINQAKDFLESRGLESLMPVTRIRLGAMQHFEGKGVALLLPEGVDDTSPLRSRVESDADGGAVALRIDRAVSPWTARQLERELTTTESFEEIAVEASESQMSKAGGAPLLLGRASGTLAGRDQPVRMQYAILDLGTEKLVARYVGSAEQLAYNESVLRNSLQSLEGQRLVTGEVEPVGKLAWSAGSPSQDALGLPIPSGWVVEPGTISACPGLPRSNGAVAAYPVRDVTFAMRAAVWSTASMMPEQAAAACSARRGSSGAASYALRADWLGVPYSIEGVFVRLGARLVQLEVISPSQKGARARELLAAWIDKAGTP